MPYRLTRGRKLVPGDPQHGTRWSTSQEKEIAARAILELETNRNIISLVPAPDQHFVGQKIRVQESENPQWYQRFVAGRWNRKGCQVKRSRVIRALNRVLVTGIVRRNGLEVSLLEHLSSVWCVRA